MQIDFYHTGYCTHPSCMVERGAGFSQAKFPAMVARIRHSAGTMLFDTGYAPRFFEVTANYPQKTYAKITPVTLSQPAIIAQLGETAHEIDTIFLSHLHADHICGLKDFPKAKILLSKEAYQFATQKHSTISVLNQIRQGFLAALLPDDFAVRAVFIEDLPAVALGDDFYPFKLGYQISSDLIAVALPGHAVGHYGLIAGEFFLVGDAVWRFSSIQADKRPNPVANLISASAKDAHATIDKLQLLYRHNRQLYFIPSHCEKTLRHLGMKGL